MRRRNLVAALGAAGALTLTGIGVAVAEPTPAPTPAPSTPAPQDESDDAEERQAIEDALSGLVEDGTLTEEQAGRVAEELADASPWHHGWGWRHHDGGEAGDRGRQAAADALGMTVEELEDALAGGGTLADVAEQRGVPVQEVVDELVAAAGQRIDEKVAEGALSQERADELKAQLPDWIAAAVENGWWSRWADRDD